VRHCHAFRPERCGNRRNLTLMTRAKNLLCAKEVRNLPPWYGLFTLNGPMEAVSTDRRGRAHLARAIRVFFAAAIALTLSYLPYRMVAQPGEQKLRDMNAELQRVGSEIEMRKTAVGKRRRSVEALKTDTRTIEDIARHDLQMLYPHEKTLRLSTRNSVTQ
jgi:cell division protein FtsB